MEAIRPLEQVKLHHAVADAAAAKGRAYQAGVRTLRDAAAGVELARPGVKCMQTMLLGPLLAFFPDSSKLTDTPVGRARLARMLCPRATSVCRDAYAERIEWRKELWRDADEPLTFYAVAKAMYPLLEDQFELHRKIRRTHSAAYFAGNKGFMETIREGRRKGGDASNLADRLYIKRYGCGVWLVWSWFKLTDYPDAEEVTGQQQQMSLLFLTTAALSASLS